MPVTLKKGPNREAARSLRISLIHMKIRDTLSKNFAAASAGIMKAAAQKPAFIALPEYFSVPGCMEDFASAENIFKETHGETTKFLSRASKGIPDIYLLGGTFLEEEDGKFYNTSTVWKNGELIGKYKKKNPVMAEDKAGVARGTEAVAIETAHCKVGLIICADMFDPDLVKQVVKLGSEVLYLPVAAMGTHPSVKGHPLTEKVAADNGVFVIKVGNVCSNAKGGRSAVIAPWGILEEVTDAQEDSVVTVDLDMQRLREYRKKLSKPWPSHPRSGSSR